MPLGDHVFEPPLRVGAGRRESASSTSARPRSCSSRSARRAAWLVGEGPVRYGQALLRGGRHERGPPRRAPPSAETVREPGAAVPDVVDDQAAALDARRGHAKRPPATRHRPKASRAREARATRRRGPATRRTLRIPDDEVSAASHARGVARPGPVSSAARAAARRRCRAPATPSPRSTQRGRPCMPADPHHLDQAASAGASRRPATWRCRRRGDPSACREARQARTAGRPFQPTVRRRRAAAGRRRTEARRPGPPRTAWRRASDDRGPPATRRSRPPSGRRHRVDRGPARTSSRSASASAAASPHAAARRRRRGCAPPPSRRARRSFEDDGADARGARRDRHGVRARGGGERLSDPGRRGRRRGRAWPWRPAPHAPSSPRTCRRCARACSRKPPCPAAPRSSTVPKLARRRSSSCRRTSARMAPQSDTSPGSRRKGRLWWEDLFNDDYLRACEKLTDEQIAREVDFIEDSLGIETRRHGARSGVRHGAPRHRARRAAATRSWASTCRSRCWPAPATRRRTARRS